jgi:DNA-binding NarL/FixJ family response regulator
MRMTDKTAVPRVVIADDHSGIVEQVAGLLRPEFDVVATAKDGISALDCIRRLDPDIALLDLYMPGMNGLDVVRTLKESSCRTATVIMTGYNDPELAKAAIAAGARAFVAKSHLTQDLLPAMLGAVRGDVFVSSLHQRSDQSGES